MCPLEFILLISCLFSAPSLLPFWWTASPGLFHFGGNCCKKDSIPKLEFFLYKEGIVWKPPLLKIVGLAEKTWFQLYLVSYWCQGEEALTLDLPTFALPFLISPATLINRINCLCRRLPLVPLNESSDQEAAQNDYSGSNTGFVFGQRFFAW